MRHVRTQARYSMEGGTCVILVIYVDNHWSSYDPYGGPSVVFYRKGDTDMCLESAHWTNPKGALHREGNFATLRYDISSGTCVGTYWRDGKPTSRRNGET